MTDSLSPEQFELISAEAKELTLQQEKSWTHLLVHYLPKINSILQTTTDQLFVAKDTTLPHNHNQKVSDKIISRNGLDENLPFVYHCNTLVDRKTRHACGRSIGTGVTVLEANIDGSSVLYCYLMVPWGSGVERWSPGGHYQSILFLICKKSDYPRLVKHGRNKISQTEAVEKIPILKDGMAEEIERETVGFLRKASLVKDLGGRINRGIILSGSPGNGKTMLCRYLKNRAKKHAIAVSEISASLIIKAFSENNLYSVVNASGLIFFDDIDISFLSRMNGDAKIACALLSAMDGMENYNNNTVRVFTTNEDTTDMDSAFLRPGRIDRIFKFGKPTETMRRHFIMSWDKRILERINAKYLIESTGECSFAEIGSIRDIVIDAMLSDRAIDLDNVLEKFQEMQAFRSSAKMGFSVAAAKKPIPKKTDEERAEEVLSKK